MIALAGGGPVFCSIGDGSLFLDVADASLLLPVWWVAAIFLVSVAMTAIDLLAVALYLSLAAVTIPAFFNDGIGYCFSVWWHHLPRQRDNNTSCLVGRRPRWRWLFWHGVWQPYS